MDSELDAFVAEFMGEKGVGFGRKNGKMCNVDLWRRVSLLARCAARCLTCTNCATSRRRCFHGFAQGVGRVRASEGVRVTVFW